MISFGIITPTIMRPSLVQCCASIDEQTYKVYRHIVYLDRKPTDTALIASIEHPQRQIIECETEYRNFGNTPRIRAWEFTDGCDYVLYTDCDNYLADPNVLTDITAALEAADLPDYACFPILRFGLRFFNENPRCCHVDSANMVCKREYARWPENRDDYTLDGIWVDGLRERPELIFRAFPEFRPIVVVPRQGKGED